MDDARTVGEQYFEAWTGKDFETARSLPQDDLAFRGPFESFDRADDFMPSIQRVSQGLLQRVGNRRVFADGDDVCIAYDFVAPPPVGSSPTVERYHVRDGRIDAIQIVFDTAPFAALSPPA